MITKDDVVNFTFCEYAKSARTFISDQTLDVGSHVQTLEGEYVCTEPSRLALDVDGNVYPIAESIFFKTYVLL